MAFTMLLRRASLAVSFTAAATGCSGGEPEVTYQYAPYAGDAYPDQRPTFTLPRGDVGLVSNNGSDSISVLDLVNDKGMGSAPAGRSPVDLDGPHHIAGDRAGGFAYVALAYPAPTTSPGPHAAHGSSARPGFVQKLAIDDLRIVGEVRIDANPGDIVLSDDGKRLVASHFDLRKALVQGAADDEKRATLTVMAPASILAEGSPDPVRITTCVAPHGVALSRPDGKTAYAACYGEDAIAVVDLEDPKAPVVRVPIGASGGKIGAPTYGPYSAVLSPVGDKLAVGNTESKDVRVFDVASRTFDARVLKTMGAPYFPAFSTDGKTLYVPTQTPDAIQIVDLATSSPVKSRVFSDKSCVLPHEAVFGSDHATLYLVCEGDHVSPSVVLALDPATLTTKATLPVGAYPDRLIVLGTP
jgi:DNA-binding beta-propeller fold protein YncE